MIKCLRNVFVIMAVFVLVLISCEESTSKPTSQLEPPEFSIQAGLYREVLHVEVTSPHADARIYFTKDGTSPNEASQVYQEAILVTSTTTIKTIAVHDDYLTSDSNSATYWINLAKVEDPIILTEEGTYYYEENIEIECPTSGADIYYTLDGSEPNQESTLYQEAFTITDSCTLKAKAFKQYYPASNIVTAEYEITQPSVSPPYFSPNPGNYDLDQTISIHCQTEDAQIYYTLDGSLPNENSLTYSQSIFINSNTLFRAIACKEGYFNSSVVSGQYIIEYQTVANPEFNLREGYYLDDQELTISTSTSDAVIYYSLDGSQPDQSSLVYSNPIILTEPTTVKAIAYKELFSPSEVVSAEFLVYHQEVTPVQFSLASGNYVGTQTLVMSCPTPGATIYYTIDETEPNENSTVYTDPLGVYGTVTINSFAMAEGYYPSQVSQARYIIGHEAPSDFVLIEGGTFNNGTSNITLDSFYMCRHEVTQAEFQALLGVEPPGDYGDGGQYPVYGITWSQAVAYCNARSLQEDLEVCYNAEDMTCNYEANGYRLPTEMEWMFAAKGGLYQPAENYNIYAGTDLESELWDYAWYDMNYANTSYIIEGKNANQLGLYDMSGNVYEWCNDWYAPYSEEDQINPTGPETGIRRVKRGGCWDEPSGSCKVDFRNFDYPSSTDFNTGFRIVRNNY